MWDQQRLRVEWNGITHTGAAADVDDTIKFVVAAADRCLRAMQE